MYSESFKTHAKPITHKIVELSRLCNSLNDEYNPMALENMNGQRLYNIDKRLDELVNAVKHLRTVFNGSGPTSPSVNGSNFFNQGWY